MGIERLKAAVKAVEVHRATFEKLRSELRGVLSEHGFTDRDQTALSDARLTRGDFLLERLSGKFDFVVGNPPYIRQELIADALLEEYRRRYATVYDRADVYVPFIERSLLLLKEGGTLTFICADRWMKNRYGGPLRRLVDRGFHLKFYIDMVNTPAFHSDVIAYPAIFSIAREPRGPTRVARQPAVEAAALRALSDELLGKGQSAGNARAVSETLEVAGGNAPWVFESSDSIRLLRRLEAEYPVLEGAGCRVGIGVATGAGPSLHRPVRPTGRGARPKAAAGDDS